MSRKKHKSRNLKQSERYNNENLTYNNPFGLNPTQLLNLLGGGDMNFLTNMLSNMGRDGIDLGGLFSNLNTNSIIGNNLNKYEDNNSKNLSDFNTETYDLNNNDDYDDEYTISKKENYQYNDENLEFLKSIRNIVDPRRGELIDKIIEKYLNGEFN